MVARQKSTVSEWTEVHYVHVQVPHLGKNSLTPKEKGQKVENRDIHERIIHFHNAMLTSTSFVPSTSPKNNLNGILHTHIFVNQHN